MSTTKYIAEITDPTTGRDVTLTATSEAELDDLIAAYLERNYPMPAPTENSQD